MIARLILALLLAAFAMPAAATPCHDAAPTHHAMPGMPDERTVPAHVCIGCIPPGDWTAARVVAPCIPARVAMPSRVVGLDVIGGGPPATPPPRAG